MASSSPTLRFQIRADFAEMAGLRSRLRNFLEERKADIDESTREETTLALDEAASNIVQHAYAGREGVIDVEFAFEGDEIVIRLWDDGRPPRCDEADSFVGSSSPLESDDEAGRGLHIIRATMSSLDYRRTASGRNLLVMRRDVKGRPWTQGEDAPA